MESCAVKSKSETRSQSLFSFLFVVVEPVSPGRGADPTADGTLARVVDLVLRRREQIWPTCSMQVDEID